MKRARPECHSPSVVIRLLRRRYPSAPNGRADPFRTLIATVLSQRTREESTARAASALLSRFPDAASLAAATPGEVVPLIRPAGFYNQKARTIIAIARLIAERGGRVPDDLEGLLDLPGVGRKTANCVLVYGFGIPAIPVDTHVHRISNRLGLVRTRTPERTEEALTASVPRRLWLDLNELFVLFGRELCRPVGPRCAECPLVRCPSRGRMGAGSRRGRACAPGFDGTVLGTLGRAAAGGRRTVSRGKGPSDG